MGRVVLIFFNEKAARGSHADHGTINEPNVHMSALRSFNAVTHMDLAATLQFQRHASGWNADGLSDRQRDLADGNRGKGRRKAEDG
jgi:hypothetical protein